MFKKRLFTAVAVAGTLTAVGLLFPAPRASAATSTGADSANWAGYVASAQSTSSGFSRVAGSWVQPTADPSAGDGDSAFWVGLGGSGQSDALEQVGTQADATNGQTVYYAWYELVPSAPVKLDLAIHPGDHISASVAVSGTDVTVSLSDQTTGQSYSNTLQMSNPDTSSAEWIAEAPSAVDGQGDVQPLPLADFGTVGFSNASATADGQTGTISAWSAQPVALDESSSAGAQASSLSSDGSSFSVAWQSSGTATASQTGGDGYAPQGYGGYGGYGDGGYGGPGGGGYGGYGYAYSN